MLAADIIDDKGRISEAWGEPQIAAPLRACAVVWRREQWLAKVRA